MGPVLVFAASLAMGPYRDIEAVFSVPDKLGSLRPLGAFSQADESTVDCLRYCSDRILIGHSVAALGLPLSRSNS